MQQILFYLRIPNIGCRIICTLIKLLLRIYTVLGGWELGIGHRGMGREFLTKRFVKSLYIGSGQDARTTMIVIFYLIRFSWTSAYFLLPTFNS